MSRLARAEVFAPDEIAVVHVINRVVRRCFLLGNDPVTGKNFDHRKVWIEDRLRQLAAALGIDLLAFSRLSNHFHFRAVRILDDESLLACAAYVDLNPIRAALAETLEQSDFTSVQRRIQSTHE